MSRRGAWLVAIAAALLLLGAGAWLLAGVGSRGPDRVRGDTVTAPGR